MHSNETYQAISLLVNACVDGNHDYYEVRFYGKPVIVGTARVYRTKGAAKQDAIRAVFQVLWNYGYSNDYRKNIANRSSIDIERLTASFEQVKPIWEMYKVENEKGNTFVSGTKATLYKQAQKLVVEMMEKSIIVIAKISEPKSQYLV